MSDSSFEEIERLADAYLDDLQAGRDPDPDELIEQHPELADALRRRLALVDMLHRATRSGSKDGAATTAESDGRPRPDGPEAGVPDTIGRFRIEGTLGHGAFGVVYRAVDEELGRNVAIKVPRLSLLVSEVTQERFLREARSAARLRHRSIVTVHEIGVDGDVPYIVSDIIEGSPLSKLLDQPIGFRRAAEIVAEVASALDAAHDQQITHRDVKPENILMDADERPFVSDFGLARLEEHDSATVTLDGQIIGTPAYMAPEQATGEHERVGPRSDIYSLGVVLYEAITGERPFRGSKTAIIQQVLHEEPQAPRTLDRSIPFDLETVCLKAMEKEPSRRYETAKTFESDLRRFLAGEPVVARPVGRVGRVWRWNKRNPVLASMTSLVALLLVAVAVGSTLTAFYFDRMAQDERDARLESTRQLARINVTTAMHLTDRGDLLGSLPYLAEALRLDSRDPSRVPAHRIRIASTLARCARVLHIWAHPKAVEHAEFDRSGSFVVTACADGAARVWNVRTGELASSPLVHTRRVTHAEFSADGGRVLTVSNDRAARIWNWSRGESVAPPLRHTADIRHATFSPDGARVITASNDGSAVIWNAATGESEHRLSHANGVVHAEFGPDGSRAVTASLDRTAKVWDTASGERIAEFEHTTRLHYATFDASGRLVVSTSQRGQILVWDSETDVTTELKTKFGTLRAAFSPDSTRLVTTGWGPKAHIWDHATGELLASLDLKRSQEEAEFAPDGRHILGRSQLTVHLWDAEGNEIGTSPRFGRILTHTALSPDGSQLLLASRDGTARLLDLATTTPYRVVLDPAEELVLARFGRGSLCAVASFSGRLWVVNAETAEVVAVPPRHESHVAAMAFSPDGELVASTSHDDTAALWNVRTGVRRFTLHFGSSGLGLDFSPSGDLLAVTSRDGKVRIWRTESGKATGFLAQHQGEARAVDFSPDGRHLVSGGHDGVVQVWDVERSEPIGKPMRHGEYVHQATFNSSGTLVITACNDGTARTWDATTGELVAESGFTHGNEMRHASFSPDGRTAFSAGYDGFLQIWNPRTGETLELSAVYEAEIDGRFSRDGSFLATASNENVARLWEVATLAPLTPPLDHAAHIRSIDISADDRTIVTASYDGSVKFWASSRDERPIEDLRALTELHSGRRIDDSGSVEFLEAAELHEIWKSLRAKYPEEFMPSPERTLRWHEREAAACEASGSWSGVITHLESVVNAGRPRAANLLRRGRAHVELGHWPDAIGDFERAIALGADPLEAAIEHTAALLASADILAYRRLCAEVFERYHGTENPRTANKVAWLCALGPAAVPDMDRVVSLSRSTLLENDAAYSKTLGAVLCRAGQFRGALLQLRVSAWRNPAGGSVWDWLFLTLVEHHLDIATSSSSLEKAERWIAENAVGEPGAERVLLEQLAREARELVHGE